MAANEGGRGMRREAYEYLLWLVLVTTATIALVRLICEVM